MRHPRVYATAIALVLVGGAAWPDARAVPTTQPDDGAAVTVRISGTPSATQPATQPAATLVKVGWMELAGALRDGPPPFAWLGEPGDSRSLRQVLAQVRSVAQDSKSAGILIRLDEPELTLSQVAQIAGALRDARAAGKKVLVYSEAYDLPGYLIAAAADRILLLKNGVLELEGLGTEEMYLLGLLDMVGVKADLMQVGRFKGAAEPLTRKTPSPDWNQNIDGVLDDLYEQVLGRLGEGRGLNREQVLKLLADVWFMKDADYVRRGLVDRVVTSDDFESVTEEEFGKDIEWDSDMGQASPLGLGADPAAFFRLLFRESGPKITRPTLALVHATGAITSGHSRAGGARAGLFDSEAIGSRTMVDLLDELADNDLVKGVVLRIDSPGGSALASEVIWQGVRQLRMKRGGRGGKPVYVSVGSMAASGGYYIASAGDEIYVNPTSLVGSIGVVGGKVVLGGLYEKLHVSIQRRSRGPLADMLNSVEPFTAPQRAAFEAKLQQIYEQFADRVKTGRGKRLPEASFDGVAQGRIFTGRQAVANGMADKVGGVDDAIRDLAAELKLKPGQYDVVDLPGPMSLAEYLESLFGVRAPAAARGAAAMPVDLALVRELLGERLWAQSARLLQGAMLLRREPVVLLCPVVLDVR